jgi:hypothetical protein
MHPINDPLNQSATKAASKIGADLEIKYTLVEEAGSSGPASFRPVLEQTGRKVKTTGGRRLSKFEPAEQTYLATLDDARDIPVSLHLDDVMPVGRLGGGEGFESFIEKEFQERIDTPWAHRGRTTEKIKGARGSISKVDEVFRGTLSADALTEAELSMHAGAKTVFDNVPTLPQELVVYRAMRASELLEEGARDVAGAVGRAYANPAPTYLTTDIRRASRHAASMRKATPDAEVVLVQLRLEEGAKVLYMGDGNVVASPGTVFQLDELLPKVNTFESTLANSTKPAGSFGSFQEANLLRYKRSLLDPATPFSDDVFTASAFARPDEGMWDFPVLSGRQVPTTQSVNTSARLGKGTKLGIEWADHSFGAPIRGASTSVSDIIVMPSIREPVRNVTAEASTFDDGIKHFYRKYRDETDVNSWLREVPSVDTSSDIYGLGQVSTADDFISSHSLIDRDEIEAVRSWYTAKENSSEALSVYMHGMADGKNATLIDDVARGIEKPGLGALELQAREKWIPALDELIETSEGAFPRPYSRTAGRSAVDDVWPATYGGSASKGTMGVGDVHINRTYMHTTVHPHKAVLDAIENKTPTLTKDGTRAVYEDVTLTRVYIKKGDKVIQVGSQEAEEFLHGRGAAFHVTEVESNAILMEVSNIQSKTEGIDTAAWFPTLDPKRAAKVDTVFVRGDIITLESVAPQQVEAAAEIGARRGGVIVPVDTGGYIAADNSYSAAWKTALRERKEAGVYDGRYAIEDIVTDTYKDSYAGNGLTSQYVSRPLDKAAAAKYVEGPQSFVPNKVKFDHEAAVKRARAADAGKKLPKKAVGHYTGIGSGEMNEISRLLDEAERLPSSRRMIRESGAWDPDVGLAETLYPKGGKFDTYAANRIIKAFNDGTLNFKWGDAEWAPRGQKLDGWLRMGLTARAGSGTTLRMQLSLQQALKYKSSPLPEDVILMRGIKGAHPGRMGGFKEGELFTNWTTGSWTGDPNLASSFGRLGGRTVDDIDDLLNLGKVTSDGSRVYSPAIVAAKKERGIMLRVKYPKGAPYTTAPDFFEEEFILGPSTFRIKKATYRGHGEASFHDVNWELRGESKALLPENAKAFADGQWGKLGLADDEIAELDQLQNFRDWLTKASQLPDDDILWVTTPYTRSDFVETLDALTDSAKYRAAVEEAAGAGREFLEGMASRAKLAGTIRPFQPPLTRWPVLSQIQVGEGSVHSGRHRVRVTIPYESIPARVLDLEYVPTAAAAEAIAPVQTQAALAEAAVKLVDDADVTFKRIARVTDEDFLPKTWLSDVDPDDARSVFTDTDIGARKIFVTEVKPADVAAHIKNGGSMHVSDSRKVGALVTDKGTVGNLFNSNGPGAGREMLLDLIENGDAKTLDCFDGFLPEYYKQFGFVEYKRVKWNDAYAPKKWDYGKHGRPDIVYMKYAGGNRATVRQRFIAGQSLTSDAQSAFERGAAISHQAEIRASFKGGAGGEMAKRKSLAAGRAVERNDKSRLILNQLAEPTDKRSPAWAIRFGDEGNEFWLGTSDVGPDLRRATTDRAAVANTVETLTTVQGFNSVDEVIEWAVSRGAKRESVTAVSRSLEAKYSRARLIDPSLRSGASAEVLVQEAKRAAKAVKKKDAQRVFLDLLERPDITRNIDGVTSRHRLSKTVRKQLFLDSVDDMTELHRSESFLPDIVTKPYSVVEVELPTPVARATGTVFDSSTLVITPPSNVAKKVIPVIKPTPGSSQIDDTASAFYGKGSGEKVTFRYVRNPEPAPNFGSLYGQDVEPAGMYVNEATSGHVPPGYDSGTLTFKSPLYIEATGAYQDKSSWKHVLSSRYRTTADSVGTTLSRRIVQDGYDGVVVIEPATAKRGSYVSEIVDLRSFVTKSEALLEDVLQNSRYLHGVGGASLS